MSWLSFAWTWKQEQMLFTYYKGYRANVRAKVNALRAMQAEGPVRQQNLADVKKYLDLLDQYMSEGWNHQPV